MLVLCTCCGVGFEKRADQVRKYPNHYCSRSCAAKVNNSKNPKRKKQLRTRICAHCAATFTLRDGSKPLLAQRFCSRACAGAARTVAAGGSRRGPEGWKERGKCLDHTKGYVLVYVPDHPRATNRGYVYEHRLVAEEMVGRTLRSDEHVHHRNGVRWDNRPENLEVMDAREHARLAGQRPEDLVI